MSALRGTFTDDGEQCCAFLDCPACQEEERIYVRFSNPLSLPNGCETDTTPIDAEQRVRGGTVLSRLTVGPGTNGDRWVECCGCEKRYTVTDGQIEEEATQEKEKAAALASAPPSPNAAPSPQS